MDDKQLQKLIRQNAAKVAKAQKARDVRNYDQTLPAARNIEEDIESRNFFNEMKKREF